MEYRFARTRFSQSSTNLKWSMVLGNKYFYVITIVLQIICVIHCIRRNNQLSWIWIIIFLPVIGSIAYLFIEIINRGQMQRVGSGLGSIITPKFSIRKLEEQLRFSDT